MNGRHRRRIVGRERTVDRRKADRGGVEPIDGPQRDVDRPVDAARFAVLACAVERIDDPHTIGTESARVLEALLRQHGVVGTVRCELLGDELLGQHVAGILDVPRRGTRGEQLLSGCEEQMSGLGRQSGGELAVGLLHRAILPADPGRREAVAIGV